MGMKPAVACGEAGPPGMSQLNVSQSSAAPMVSNMPGFMPLLKATAFIAGGQPEAPEVPESVELVEPSPWVELVWPLPGGSWARPSKPTPGLFEVVWAGSGWLLLEGSGWLLLEGSGWLLLAGSWASFGAVCPVPWVELVWPLPWGSWARPSKPTPRLSEAVAPVSWRRVHLAETVRAKRHNCSRRYITNVLQPRLA